ncbi:RNA-directed DNA polymerase [bacterium]|nr:RNA-directed DNA polymerase [bacterium]
MQHGLVFCELVKAYFDCRRYKRNKLTSLDFEFALESSLCRLYDELISGKYKIGPSVCFVILNPKPREVWAANFRDRIVHHLIYNAVSQRYYRTFISDTYSCIPKRGTINAAKTLQKYIQDSSCNFSNNVYYLKCDIKNFFVSVNKDILYGLMENLVTEEWLLKLIKQVIYNECSKTCILHSPRWKYNLIPKYKSLWHTSYNKGLPIGNLTSQFFSNVYLNVLDQYVKHHWHCKYYCRYVDDFVILDENPKKLNAIHKDLTRFLKEKLDLELHDNKKSINKVVRGVDFVGFVNKPNRIFIRQKTIKKIFKRIRVYKESSDWYNKEKMDSFIRSMNSYLGLLRNVSGYNLRKKICWESINLFIGCDAEYTKLFSN